MKVSQTLDVRTLIRLLRGQRDASQLVFLELDGQAFCIDGVWEHDGDIVTIVGDPTISMSVDRDPRQLA